MNEIEENYSGYNLSNMIVFAKYIENKYLLFFACLSTTLLFAVAFKMAIAKLDDIFYKIGDKSKN